MVGSEGLEENRGCFFRVLMRWGLFDEKRDIKGGRLRDWCFDYNIGIGCYKGMIGVDL